MLPYIEPQGEINKSTIVIENITAPLVTGISNKQKTMDIDD